MPIAPMSPISGNQFKSSGRKPLQPKNQSAATNIIHPKPIEISQSHLDNANKENIPPTYTPVKKPSFQIQIQPFDASLAEELRAIRKKLDRLRIDKENTDKMLAERSAQLDFCIKGIIEKGELQKQLEIEVDHIYRFNQIILSSMRRPPVRSMREKEQEKKMKQEQTKGTNKTEESLVTNLNSEVVITETSKEAVSNP